MSGNLSSSTAIPEGFICAECHSQFYSAEQLLQHFETHSTNSGSNNNNSFLPTKGKKILNFPSSFSDSIKNTQNNYPSNNFSNYPQPLGKIRSQIEDFQKLRKVKIDHYSSEANKLLIRLSKILRDLPEDIKLRRIHEQSVVDWIDEKLVSRCPNCAKSLGIRFRPHHCRLCGSVICESCSRFIKYEGAKLLIEKLGGGDDMNFWPNLNIRICEYCQLVTNSRIASDSQSSTQSQLDLVQLYEKLQEQKLKSTELLDNLIKVSDSMWRGESLHSLQQATELRATFIKSTELLHNLSSRIMAHGAKERSQKLNTVHVVLQDRIKIATVNFIRNLVISMPGIPQEFELKKGGLLESKSGFEAKATKVIFDDPIQQQIYNLREFIEQAKKAGRKYEVEALTKSLEEFESLKLKN